MTILSSNIVPILQGSYITLQLSCLSGYVVGDLEAMVISNFILFFFKKKKMLLLNVFTHSSNFIQNSVHSTIDHIL